MGHLRVANQQQKKFEVAMIYNFNSQTFGTLLQYGDLQLIPEVDHLPH